LPKSIWLLLALIVVVPFNNCSQGPGFSTQPIQSLNASLASEFGNSIIARSNVSDLFSEDIPYSKRLIASTKSGQFSDNCLDNNSFDACLVWKNPISQDGSPLTQWMTTDTNLTPFQKFGVILPQTDRKGVLANKNIWVGESGNAKTISVLNLSDSGFLLDSSKPLGRKALAHLMAYFWANTALTNLQSRTGIQYIQNYQVSFDVLSLANESEQNAYYYPFTKTQLSQGDAGTVVMGYWTDSDGGQQDLAISAEVLVHELGHSQFALAQKNTITDLNSYQRWKCKKDLATTYTLLPESDGYPTGGTPSTCSRLSRYCKTEDGCVGAIEEGLADFYFMMVFPENVSVGEMIRNQVDPFNLHPDNIGAPRGVSHLNNLTVSEAYDLSAEAVFTTNFEDKKITNIRGEIHDMGAVFASLLWSVYAHPETDKRAWEKTYFTLLPRITGSSTFSSVYANLIKIDHNDHNSTNSKFIEEVFSKKGVSKK
jgi:hypothetical protein